MTARAFTGTETVGALFASTSSTSHFCTASVVDSPRGDILLTAAHCITGTAAGYVFAPGYHDGFSPYGRWTVTAAYVDPAWIARQDPQRDFAFLTVAPRSIAGREEQIEQVTGANRLDARPVRAGERVTIPAYAAGTDDEPITCTVPVYYHGRYPAFDCDPYPGGTSGAPLMTGTAVRGVIGGLHQGGCETFTSYSAPLGKAARRAYAAAIADDAGDRVPAAGGDGCV
jgi:V8-like Glu-specific endopeptidase